jgi:uncharacterized protein
MNTIEPVSFVSEGLRLEGRLRVPDGAQYSAVICHPHPLYGGSMDNNVVGALAGALEQARVAALCFNFRGVGGSEGDYGDMIGELDDTRAAIEIVRQRFPGQEVLLAGYSFGAAIALLVGYGHPSVGALLAVAPPLSMFDIASVTPCAKPKLLLAGDRDPYCPRPALERLTSDLPAPTEMCLIEGADHFLSGFESQIAASAETFARVWSGRV